MKEKLKFTLSAPIWLVILLVAYVLTANAQTGPIDNKPAAKKGFTPQASGPSLPVLGSGTIGQLSKWTGLTSSNSILGDSIITETKLGNIGIGTTAPTSKLTVQGMIESTLGGYKFPDGSLQTTAAVSGLTFVVHDLTLTGNGTGASPLGVAVPLLLSGSIASPILSATQTGAGVAFLGQNDSGTAINGKSKLSAGIVGESNNDDGVLGKSNTGPGVHGTSNFNFGILGETTSGTAVVGISVGEGNGVGGAAPPGLFAGDFHGDVRILGDLNVSGQKNFKIDHPLDPENKYLLHASIESSEVMNLYSGNVTLDSGGEAMVKLPSWFQTLNKDFRYSLTPIGGFAPLYIAEKIADNRFKIAGGQPGMEVSWQVAGLRDDAYMQKHPMLVELDKPAKERGFYLHPDLYDQPEEKDVEWARQPELMKRIKEMNQKSKQQ
ncbi:MAG TPA: hypothetical protein VFF31_01845 [Blastocatellia bacterium]|nr:hypothetical protein [Blastocatellia bacterium]